MQKVIIFLLCVIFQTGFAYKSVKPTDEDIIKIKVQIASMVAADQAIRYGLLDHQKKGGAVLTNQSLFKYWQEIDDKNSKKVEEILTKWGWLGPKIVGRTCYDAIWLLIQHSDKNVALQEKTLTKLTETGLKDPQDLKHYAYLYDRVQVNKHLPQRYGTQGSCKKKGSWQPFKIENEKTLNELRKSVGLGSFESYRQITNKLCY